MTLREFLQRNFDEINGLVQGMPPEAQDYYLENTRGMLLELDRLEAAKFAFAGAVHEIEELRTELAIMSQNFETQAEVHYALEEELRYYKGIDNCFEHVDNPISSKSCHACGKRGAWTMGEWSRYVGKAERAVIALQEIEWHGSMWIGNQTCPSCGAEKDEGHFEDCPVHIALTYGKTA